MFDRSIATIIFAALAGCASEQGDSAVPAVDGLSDSGSTGLDSAEVDGWLGAAAADQIAARRGWTDRMQDVLVLDDGSWRYRYGAEYIEISPVLGSSVCVEVSDGACPSVPSSWEDVAQAIADEESELVDESAAMATSCSAPCGADDGLTFAGQTAYSNGSTTGTGSSCAGGDSYQCTQFVDKVHRHYGTTYGSNWTGNAYTGYLGTTGSAAFAKGLIPFAPGSSYDAPLSGDIAVWYKSGTYGHVGIISSVASSSATVTDQNRSCGDQSCKLIYSSTSGYSLGNGTASGYCGAEGLSSYTLKAWLRRGWDFSGAFGMSGWSFNQMSYTSGTTSGTASDLSDYTRMTVSGSDPYVVSPSGQAIQAYNSSSASWGYKYLRVYMKSTCSNKTAAVYWKKLGGSWGEAYKVTATLSGSSFQLVTFNLSADSDWTGTIDQIRLDPSATGTSGCTIDVAYAYFDR